MKLNSIFLLLFFLSMGCQLKNSPLTIDNLPVIDILEGYSKKEIVLQDIAQIEYVPLETTDSVLLDRISLLSYVSDQYILVWNFYEGDIFVFNRNGKIISNFNHKGQGPEEYYPRGMVVFDEKNEEIFIFNGWAHRILVYSLNGQYKRTLNHSTDLFIASAYNFDDETILIYDGEKIGLHRKNYSEKPYMLLSKKDGSIVDTFDIRLPVRYSNSIAQEIDLVGGEKMYTPLLIPTPNNSYYGLDFVIANISSDTIYLLTQNRNLRPILVRQPSVHLFCPRIVWSSLLTTDKFIVLNKATLDFIAVDKGQSIPNVTLIYEFETGETSEVVFLNADLSMGQWIPPGSISPDIGKNMVADLMPVSRLKTAYEDKKLKGKLEQLVATLNEEDNPIVRIIKFK